MDELFYIQDGSTELMLNIYSICSLFLLKLMPPHFVDESPFWAGR